MVQLVVSIFFALMFVNVSLGSITFGTCTLSCEVNEHEANGLLGLDRVQGAPGRKGPAGPKGQQGPRGHRGEQGPPGTACDCSDNDQLRRKLYGMQTEIDTLKEKETRNTENGERLTRELNMIKVEVNALKASTGFCGWTKASNGFYYKYFGHEKVNYETAKSRCANLGARLAAAGLRTAALRSEIRAVFPTTSFPDTWIGLDDLVQQGTYVWSDGVVSTRANTDWHQFEPNDNNERCCLMYQYLKGQVNDKECSHAANYLCESNP